MKTPFLVQRIKIHPDGKPRLGEKGINKFFRLDYMGSAEFEFGALPASLRRLRETPKISEPKRIKVDGHIVWYVGPEDLYETAEMLFRDQLNEPMNQKIRLKERTEIFASFVGDDWLHTKRDDFVGWWDIQNDWAFFTKKDRARDWIRGVWES